MGRRDLEAACAEFNIHIEISDDGNFPIHNRENDFLFEVSLVSFVFWVDGDRSIAHHGLRPCGGHDQVTIAIFEGVFEMVEFSHNLLMLYFQIGEGGLASWTPVDDIVAPVNQPLLIESDENLFDCFRETFVHRKAFPTPIAGGSQFLQLADDRPPGLFLPFPNPLDKLLPAQEMTVQALLHELPLHHILSSNPCVIRSGHPEGSIILHPLISYQDILQGIVEGVSNVE